MKENAPPPVEGQIRTNRTRFTLNLVGKWNRKFEGGFLDWPAELQDTILEAIRIYIADTREPWVIEPETCVCKFDLEAGHWYIQMELAYRTTSVRRLN